MEHWLFQTDLIIQNVGTTNTFDTENRGRSITEAGTITFILISDQIVDHCSKIDLRSYQDHMAVK
jgi:hypothetical protein